MKGSVVRRSTILAVLLATISAQGADASTVVPNVIAEFRTPTPFSSPWGIAAGPDGNIWFVEKDDPGRVGRSTPQGQMVEFVIPTPGAYPQNITAGPDGAMWFTENGASKVGRITMDGQITEFGLPPHTGPQGLTTGPDGNLWIAETYGNAIARMTPQGALTEFPIPMPNSYPEEITTGSDGALWATAGGIWRITVTGDFTYVFAGDTGQYGITSGPDGALWFTDGVHRVGRVTTDGRVKLFRNGDILLPVEIAAGRDHAMWFTNEGEKIGRLAADGSFRFLRTPTNQSYPTGITLGPDGNLWFTENAVGKIGRVPPPR
jgi:virginiamycin B lyase